MHTKDRLAAALAAADLPALADRAACGHYHAFLSPLDDPAGELERDLAKAGTPAALALRQRHRNGDFRATPEESDAPAVSFAAGDIVLVGDAMPFWAGCLVRVEDVKAWGIRGAVFGPQQAEYPIRVARDSIVTVYRRISDGPARE